MKTEEVLGTKKDDTKVTKTQNKNATTTTEQVPTTNNYDSSYDCDCVSVCVTLDKKCERLIECIEFKITYRYHRVRAILFIEATLVICANDLAFFFTIFI